jgi:hypothetical protein
VTPGVVALLSGAMNEQVVTPSLEETMRSFEPSVFMRQMASYRRRSRVACMISSLPSAET